MNAFKPLPFVAVLITCVAPRLATADDVTVRLTATVILGTGNSASGRLGAFQNKLGAASQFIEAGDIKAACEQLLDACRRAAGIEPVPDFVAGEALVQAQTSIAEGLAALGCA